MGKGHSKNFDVNVVTSANGDITGIKYTEKCNSTLALDTAILPLDNVKDTEEEVVMAETNTTVESKAADAVEDTNNTQPQTQATENDTTQISPSSDAKDEATLKTDAVTEDINAVPDQETANETSDSPADNNVSPSTHEKPESKKEPSEKKKRSKSFLKAFTLKKKHETAPKAEAEPVNQTETEKQPETEEAEVKVEEPQDAAATEPAETEAEMKDTAQTVEEPSTEKTEDKPEAEAEAAAEVEKTEPEAAGKAPAKKKGGFFSKFRLPKKKTPAAESAPAPKEPDEAKEEEKPVESTENGENEAAKSDEKPEQAPEAEKPADAEGLVIAGETEEKPKAETEEVAEAPKVEEAAKDEAAPEAVAVEDSEKAEDDLPTESVNLNLLESSDLALAILEEQLQELVERAINEIQNDPQVLDEICNKESKNRLDANSIQKSAENCKEVVSTAITETTVCEANTTLVSKADALLAKSESFAVCSQSSHVKTTTRTTNTSHETVLVNNEHAVDKGPSSTFEVERSGDLPSVEVARSFSFDSDKVELDERVEKSEKNSLFEIVSKEELMLKLERETEVAKSEHEPKILEQKTYIEIEESPMDTIDYRVEAGDPSSTFWEPDHIPNAEYSKIDEDSRAFPLDIKDIKSLPGTDGSSGTGKSEHKLVTFEKWNFEYEGSDKPKESEMWEDSDDDGGFSTSEVESGGDIVRSATLAEVDLKVFDCEDDNTVTVDSIDKEEPEPEPEPAAPVESAAEPEPAAPVEVTAEPKPAAPVESAVEPEPAAPVESAVEPEPAAPVESAVEPEPAAPVESAVEPEPAVPVESAAEPEAPVAEETDANAS